MILYDERGKKFIAFMCSQPKIKTLSPNKNWVYIEKSIDMLPRRFHYEKNSGKFVYFFCKGQWYKISRADEDFADIIQSVSFATNKERIIDWEEQKEEAKNITFFNSLYEWNTVCRLQFIESDNVDVCETWMRVLGKIKSSSIPNERYMESLSDFMSIIRNPSMIQKQIIKFHDGVLREHLLTEDIDEF